MKIDRRSRAFIGPCLLALTACNGGAKGVVKDYLSQKDCAERTKFILDPDKNKSVMLEYLKAMNKTSCDVPKKEGLNDSDCDGKKDGEYCAVKANGNTYEVKKTPDGFKIDFRATYGYGSDTLAGVKARMAAGIPVNLAMVRVTAKLDTPKENGTLSVLLEDRAVGLTREWASVSKESPDTSGLVKLLLDGKEHPVTLVVTQEGRNELGVLAFIQEGWRQLEEEVGRGAPVAKAALSPATPSTASSAAATEVPPADVGDAGAGSDGKASLRQGAMTVNGRLPPEVIQRIVRQNFGRFRLCYENGLRTNPKLKGRVGVKFVIDRTGDVSTASDGGSDLPDPGVVGCVVRGFGNLKFPQPEGGIVTVVYPVIFSPGD